MAVRRPVLFLDVDGPLIPFGTPSNPASGPASGPGRFPSPASEADPDRGNPLTGRLDPSVGLRLTGLGCELVWATTWMDEANRSVGPRIGLPRLRVVEWPETSDDEGPRSAHGARVPRGLHWKTPALVEWADGRPFIWVDDEIGPVDRLWVDARYEGPSLLHRVDPAVGLGEDDFSVLTEWLRTAVPDLARRTDRG
ncbi:hypothetical protein [Streptomyces sp. NPDC002580]|uniref:hypothetical protein n=1 Tax=Streptomyces sp. NPDC002580 TaxID=3364653 RepID=UPI0036C28485